MKSFHKLNLLLTEASIMSGIQLYVKLDASCSLKLFLLSSVDGKFFVHGFLMEKYYFGS